MLKIFFGGHNSRVPLIAGTDTFLTNAFRKNFEVVDDQQIADIFVSVDFSKSDLESVKHHIPRERRILIRLEPKIVWPTNYGRHIQSNFGFVVNVGRNPELETNTTPWPQYWNQVLEYQDTKKIDENSTAIISGNKISFVSGELYSLRRECINKINNISLYGTNWNLSQLRKLKVIIAEFVYAIKSANVPRVNAIKYWFRKYPAWKGAPENKLETLSKYRQTLVIENSIDYITEKLFDAFAARAIPIYVGPPVELFGIPETLIIKAEPNERSVEKALRTAKSLDFDLWRSELEAWLNLDSTFTKWDSQHVYKKIVELCVYYLNTEEQNI